MRRLTTFILIVSLILSVVACAENNVDWSQYTDEELQETITDLSNMLNAANQELKNRNVQDNGEPMKSNDESRTIILDYDGLQIYMSKKGLYTEQDYDGLRLYVDVVVENHSVIDYEYNGSTLMINGWQVDGLAYGEIISGKKAKNRFYMIMDGADITTIDEVETIGFEFTICDKDYNYITLDPVEISVK